VAANVLRLIDRARADGVGIVLITHNAGHAMAVGDEFTVLIHGKVADHFQRGERTREEVLSLMAGGAELDTLSAQLEQESGDGRPVAERALPTGR
jgi:simple sugar transport system ATP-binding protein